MPRPPPPRGGAPLPAGSMSPGDADKEHPNDLAEHLLLDEDQLNHPSKAVRCARRICEAVVALLLAALIVWLVRDDLWRVEHRGAGEPGTDSGSGGFPDSLI